MVNYSAIKATELDPQAVDNMLSKELESLSFKDRNRIQEEMHGVVNLCPKETPEMMAESLEKMQRHLDCIPIKSIYDKVSPSSYIHSASFRLRFLRCELYDCKKAAERLVRFTEYMEEEYDIETLERPLKLIDLYTKSGKRGKEVMDCFKSGHTQALPFRDRSGRRVIVTIVKHAMAYDADIRYKSYQYLLLQSTRDEETQRAGVVFVMWGKGGGSPWPDIEEHTRATKVFNDMPVRVASMHQVFDDTPAYKLVRAVNVLMMQGAGNKMRLMTHLGENWEARYDLLGYGIPVELLPITETNKIKTKNYNLWIKAQKTIEELEERVQFDDNGDLIKPIDCPALQDVVFKAGTSNLSHPGNTMYRDLLQASYNDYVNAPSQSEKQAVVIKIANQVTRNGGNFLEWDSDSSCWLEIENDVKLRTKIYSSFLYYKKMVDTKRNLQSTSCSTYMFERQDGRKRKRLQDGSEQSGCCQRPSCW